MWYKFYSIVKFILSAIWQFENKMKEIGNGKVRGTVKLQNQQDGDIIKTYWDDDYKHLISKIKE